MFAEFHCRSGRDVVDALHPAGWVSKESPTELQQPNANPVIGKRWLVSALNGFTAITKDQPTKFLQTAWTWPSLSLPLWMMPPTTLYSIKICSGSCGDLMGSSTVSGMFKFQSSWMAAPGSSPEPEAYRSRCRHWILELLVKAVFIPIYPFQLVTNS